MFINEEEIVKIIDREYSLDVQMIEHIDKGVANHNFLIQSSSGKFIFKIYRSRTFEEVAFEVNILLKLSGLSFPSPRLAAKNDTTYIAEIGTNSGVMYEYIEGSIVEVPNTDELNKIGQLVGDMHTKLKTFFPDGKKETLDISGLEEWLKKDKTRLSNRLFNDGSRITDFLFIELSDVKNKLPEDVLPMGITHQDVKPENIIMTEEGELVIIDFDNAYRGTLLFDVMTTPVWTCFDRSGLNIKRFRSYLAGYMSNRPFTELEKKHFLLALRFRLLQEIGIWLLLYENNQGSKYIKKFKNAYDLLPPIEISVIL